MRLNAYAATIGAIGMSNTSILRAIVEECPLAIAALDQDNRVWILSRAARRMFGWTGEELGRSLPIAPELLEAQLHLGSSHSADLTWPREGAEPLDVSFSVSPLCNDEGKV